MKPPTTTSVETPPAGKSAAGREAKIGRSPKAKANAAANGAASPSSTVKEKQDKKLKDNAVTQQLTKTKMCAFFERGKCASVNCRYAHSNEELRTAPNLQKTKLCRSFLSGGCNDENCPFAHGDGDLRVTEGIYKTQICNFFERGYCKKGDRCNHAHGAVDLRPTAPTATTPLSKMSPTSNVSAGAESVKPRRSPLPLAELLVDSEGNFNTPTPVSAVPPTPTKSVTELASLAFSPMPSSPLWGYGMRQLSPASTLGAVGNALSTGGSTPGDLVRAMWPREPVDVLVDQHARSPTAQPGTLSFGMESERPFEQLGSGTTSENWLPTTEQCAAQAVLEQRPAPVLVDAASPSSAILSPPPLAPPSLVAPTTPAPPATTAMTMPTPPPPTPPPPPPVASKRPIVTEPPVERPLEPDLAMADLSERLASLDGVMRNLSKDIENFRSDNRSDQRRLHRI
mmetsp:Transcript_87679/g.151932  ORF Transcript_87679/g.151932 Transcript_87679/m.151932 type:complete len:455 (-) Transcript_87679:133-1497(-)